ncbi:MAG: O-antigen ligase family protein [Bacillota bacterium]
MDWSRLLRYSGLALLLAVLTAGPFFRGLFFWTELLAAIAAVSVGFLLWLTGRRLGNLPLGLPGGAAGWALLALLLVYMVQFAWAVFPRGNLDWALRVAAGWMAYVMARQEAGPGLRRWLGWGFVLSAAGVAVMGFLEYSGYFTGNPELAQMLSLVGLQSRLFTIFQYPNTGAVYFLAALFTSAGLALEDRKGWKVGLAASLMTLLALAFFFALSRGALVVLPFGLALLLIGLDREQRWPGLLLTLLPFGAMLAVAKGVGTATTAKDWVGAVQWIAAAMALAALGGLLLHAYLRLRVRLQLIVAGILLAAVVGGIGEYGPHGLLPKQASRLFQFSFDGSVAYRLYFSQDAFRIAMDKPLGRGGWGWDRTYLQYQRFHYTARETHNHYLQTAVEAGFPGLAALLAALGAGLWAAWQRRRGSVLAWSMAAGAGLILAHSLIDFNLSFGQVWILVLALLGASATPAAEERYQTVKLWTGAAGGVAVAGLAALLFLGSRSLDGARGLQAAGQPEAAKEAARQAARYDRWDSGPLLILGDQASLERATRLDPALAQPHFELALVYERQKDYNGALREARLALESYPMSSLTWNKTASLAGKILVDQLHNGQLEAARQSATELAELGDAFLRRKSEADPLQKLWRAPALSMDAEFELRYGQALYLAGREAEAEPLLKAAAKVGLLRSEADVWLYALYERRGDARGLKALEGKPWIRFRGTNPVFKVVRAWQ